MIAFINKFRSEFKALLSQRNALGNLARNIDLLNFRTTYFGFLDVVKEELMKSNDVKDVQDMIVEINGYIMKHLYM